MNDPLLSGTANNELVFAHLQSLANARPASHLSSILNHLRWSTATPASNLGTARSQTLVMKRREQPNYDSHAR
eukprot:2305382-Amphidinium_carterae.1